GPSVPLYEPETDAYDSNQPIFDALEDTILKLDFMVNSNRQDSEALARGAFPDIRLPPQQFAAHGHAAYRVALALGLRKTARFLDVGCGGGVKVVMASHFFPTCHGLEFDPGYARAAEVVIEGAEVPNGKVIEADALAFEGYADYDVVYFFQPMQTKEGLYALEQQIIDHVRPQTILIAPYLPFRSRFQELGCAHIAGCVYLSATTEAEGNSIRDNAERTGLKVSPDVEAVPWGNVWRPALKAFAANGFVP
ncbi:MAG: class I SAM-dependent methyltransferase, partial [Pseudomonadota bacterium]